MGKNSQNSKHQNFDAKLDILCDQVVFRDFQMFVTLCLFMLRNYYFFHQLVIFKGQQLRQWKAKKRHIHTTNLDGKKSAGHKFPFWSWEAHLWLLKNSPKKVMSGNGVLPGAARTVVPGRSTQRGSGSPYDNGSDSESSDVPWWKILETGSWFGKLGKRSNVVFFKTERVESVFGLFVIFFT